jgi:hypothetical protein
MTNKVIFSDSLSHLSGAFLSALSCVRIIPSYSRNPEYNVPPPASFIEKCSLNN